MDNDTLNRTEAVRQLYAKTFSNLINTSIDAGANQLQANRLVASLAEQLANYGGPADDQHCFLQWAASILAPASAAFVIIEQNRGIIESAFTRVLATCPDFASREPGHRSELYSDLLVWIIEHLSELLKPGTAKLSTRIYAAARFTAMSWRKIRIRHGQRFTRSAEDVESELIRRGTMRQHGKLPYFVTGWAADGPEEKKLEKVA